MTLAPTCPAPAPSAVIQLAHGGGGRTSFRLLEELILPALGLADGAAAPDAAALHAPPGARLVFTTDSSVVRPAFFPGGDIGRLAVFGAVNDLAAAGARPLALSLALILEEGLPLETLRRVLESVCGAAQRAGVRIATGDTKVVDRGKGDGIYLSTAAVGVVLPGLHVEPRRIVPGDAILVSGDVGRHGIAVLSVREGLSFGGAITSDCAPVTPLLEAVAATGVELHCLRDPTRGGLGAVLHELALGAGVAMEVVESAVPVAPQVAAACELLGLDPLAMACEGRLVLVLPEAGVDAALAALRAVPLGAGAARVGTVLPAPAGRVSLTTRLGTRRLLDFAASEQLPRIC